MAQVIHFGEDTFSITWDTPEDMQSFIDGMIRTKDAWAASGSKNPLVWVRGRNKVDD